MLSLNQCKLLELPSDAIHVVRKKYDMDKAGKMDEAIDILNAWIRKQDHFTNKDFSRDYLERIIITCKGSIERAKTKLDKLCTVRTMLPEFFEKTDARNELNDVHSRGYFTVLPKLTDDYYRVLLLKGHPGKLEERHEFVDFFRYNMMIIEYLYEHDYFTGLILVADFSDVNLLSILPQCNIQEMRQYTTILTECYGTRLKEIHIITSSKIVEAFISILKQIMSAKLGKRIIVHRSGETLSDFIPKKILPSEYGGKEKSLSELHEELLDVTSSKEHADYLKKMKEVKTNEALRSKALFNDQYMGMPGTFRTLSVD